MKILVMATLADVAVYMRDCAMVNVRDCEENEDLRLRLISACSTALLEPQCQHRIRYGVGDRPTDDPITWKHLVEMDGVSVTTDAEGIVTTFAAFFWMMYPSNVGIGISKGGEMSAAAHPFLVLNESCMPDVVRGNRVVRPDDANTNVLIFDPCPMLGMRRTPAVSFYRLNEPLGACVWLPEKGK